MFSILYMWYQLPIIIAPSSLRVETSSYHIISLLDPQPMYYRQPISLPLPLGQEAQTTTSRVIGDLCGPLKAYCSGSATNNFQSIEFIPFGSSQVTSGGSLIYRLWVLAHDTTPKHSIYALAGMLVSAPLQPIPVTCSNRRSNPLSRCYTWSFCYSRLIGTHPVTQ